MTNKVFEQIAAGLREAVEIQAGRADPASYRVHVPETVDVKSIRKSLGLTQEAFANRYGFSKGAVTDWEQGRSRPEASTRMFLTVIAREPEAVDRALAAA